jgi:DNA gyrase subunit A
MSDTETKKENHEERIFPRSIEREMKESYLTYALSVIHSRALPDVRDGLKPSQRRILVAMNDLNLGPRAKYRKCAKVAGDTSGNYHPHGEAVIYPTLVRMAQDFSLRYPLIDGQGNFGSIDGDPPAAMRYTESRMAGIATELMADLDRDTVEYEPNYDESRTQPTVLPSRFPNLLCNGSDGIAVGMATSLPPHNLREVTNALRAVLDNPKVELSELVQMVPGPDFPTGGIIMGRSGIARAYSSGRGQLKLRARHHIEEKGVRESLVFTEIPYQVRKTLIIEKMVDLVRDGRITGISDVRDESDREGMRLVVELKKNEDPQIILNQLFKFTPLQTTVSIINLAIDGGQPRTFTLKGLLESYLTHRREVIRRRTAYLLRKAEDRKHIVDGLRIAVGNIDQIVKIVRESSDRDDAKKRLVAAFALSDRQSQAIVDMRLGSLTGLEIEKLDAEHAALLAEIGNLEDILARDERVAEIIHADLDEMVEKYGDERRTEISEEEIDGSFDMEALIAEELMVVTVSRDGWIKRVPIDNYRAQGRGGRGIKGSEAKEGDVLTTVFAAGTHDYLLCFSNLGKVHWVKVYRLPEAGRTAKGRPLANLIHLEAGEVVSKVLRVTAFSGEESILFATRMGVVKKTALDAYSRPRTKGIRAINLQDGDEVVSVGITQPGDTIVLCSANGKAAHFDEKAVRQMGRTSRGVRGIRLRGDDVVVAMAVADPEAFLLVACEKGHGKRTPIADYPVKGRGNQGVISIQTKGRNGKVISSVLCHEGDDALYISEGGMLVRTSVADISSMGRNTQGVKLVNLKSGDRLVGLEIVSERDLEQYAARSGDEAADSEEKDASAVTAPMEAPMDVASAEADADVDEETEETEEPTEGEE